MMYVFMHAKTASAPVPAQPRAIPTNRPDIRQADVMEGEATPPDSVVGSPSRPSPLTTGEGDARAERARMQFLAMMGSR